MHCLVTVGSTKFPQLVQKVQSEEFLEALTGNRFGSLTVQYGCYEWSPVEHVKLNIQGFDYSEQIKEEFSQSDLIISHAGSGSILEALRMRKKLIVVVNTSLQDNHQQELAHKLHGKYLLCATCSNLEDRILEALEADFEAFPDPNPHALQAIIDRLYQ